MNVGRSILIGLGIGAIVGAIPATLMCSVALEHNPQEEFVTHATGAYTANLYQLFAGWMIACGGPVALVTTVLL